MSRATNKTELLDQAWALVDWTSVRSVIDAGCGNGDDLLRIAWQHGYLERLVGIDRSAEAIARAKARLPMDSRFEFFEEDLATYIHPDASFDLVVSSKLLECLPDKQAFLAETNRILKPGGQVLCAHWDWDSQLFDGSDRDLVRKMVHAYSDWQQDWMQASDPWMGRRLWRTFQEGGQFHGDVHPFVLVETDFEPGCIGYDRAHDFQALVKRRKMKRAEYDRFMADLEELARKGRYFYSINLYVYYGVKKPIA